MAPCLPRLLSAYVACAMPVKRKLAAAAVCAPAQTSNGSRFVDCPVCSQRVAHYLINSHLDYECGRSTSSSADARTEATAAMEPVDRAGNSTEEPGTWRGHRKHTYGMVDVQFHIA